MSVPFILSPQSRNDIHPGFERKMWLKLCIGVTKNGGDTPRDFAEPRNVRKFALTPYKEFQINCITNQSLKMQIEVQEKWMNEDRWMRWGHPWGLKNSSKALIALWLWTTVVVVNSCLNGSVRVLNRIERLCGYMLHQHETIWGDTRNASHKRQQCSHPSNGILSNEITPRAESRWFGWDKNKTEKNSIVMAPPLWNGTKGEGEKEKQVWIDVVANANGTNQVTLNRLIEA